MFTTSGPLSAVDQPYVNVTQMIKLVILCCGSKISNVEKWGEADIVD